MPDDRLSPTLKSAVDVFTMNETRFADSRKGIAASRAIARYVDAITLRPGDPISRPSRRRPDAIAPSSTEIIALIDRLPPQLALAKRAPLIDIGALPTDEAQIVLTAALRTLLVGLTAVLQSPAKPREGLGDAILHAAFGADSAATLVRTRLGPGDLPWPGRDDVPLPDFGKIIRAGELRDFVRTIAECGYAAQQGADWHRGILATGRVTLLSPARGCAGDRIEIGYSGLGAAPPPGDILIALPQRGGCAHVSLRAIAPDLFAGRWADSGRISLVLPPRIFSGAVGFFVVPPPVAGSGPCGPGSLTGAAGGIQQILAGQLGAVGIMIGQSVIAAAARAEAGQLAALPCAAPQSDGANMLQAGPPEIDMFDVVEPGGVHPRGTATLRWRVVNADSVDIVARDVVGSEAPHELPAITSTLAIDGQCVLAIPCTRRWEGEYVLRAYNANGCAPVPVEASVRLASMFSHYRLGVGTGDVTDDRPGLPMVGFSDDMQKSSGVVDLPLRARAFVIEENKASAPTRIAMVVADIWGADQRLKTEVIARLNAGRTTAPYSDATLIIGATHTHAGAGCYSEYYMYNKTGGGFDPVTFERIVGGIIAAVRQAESALVPGRIYVRAGELEGVGANRSLAAHLGNTDARPGDESELTDREMLLLKLVEDVDNRGHVRPVGAINWHAIHPTNLGMFNQLLSGDNKGWAARLFEDEMARRQAPRFVAAFGNAAAGDVSGNFTRAPNGDVIFEYPRGAPSDYVRMMDNARLQYEHALALFDAADEEVTGPLQVRHVFNDMSSIEILAQPGVRTAAAAFGVSFGAGSAEDSEARTTMNGATISSGIVEGFTTLTRVPCVAAVAGLALIPALSAIPAIIVGGVPLILTTAVTLAPVAAGVVPIVMTPEGLKIVLDVVMSQIPQPLKSYINSAIAGAIFPSTLERPNLIRVSPLPGAGSWRFDVPVPFPGSRGEIAGHGMKPIMFAPGVAELVFTPESGGAERRWPCPLVPHVLPSHLIRIGQVAIAAVPAEFTATAGRRLKTDVRGALGPDVSHAAIFGFANAYSGYVATAEEYDHQHYEGASTLFGPHTLAAYRQIFADLAAGIANNTAVFGNVAGPCVVPAIYVKP